MSVDRVIVWYVTGVLALYVVLVVLNRFIGNS